ncbi:MAG: hypothetical protein K6U12_06715 [Armatimonadetes bacterium]|nr:hypothetical protein [Armatimonadota bacterium]CUU35214.1 hypothetical protein DCOP10_11475 [Armatimonadetes bacterium DC]
MERYADLSGRSGVAAYEIGDDYIRVQFKNGSIYLYTYESAGREHIETMKELARKGEGLSGYISRYVRNLYARKER